MVRIPVLTALAFATLLAATPAPAKANFLDRIGDMAGQLNDPLFAKLDITKALAEAKQAALDAAAKAKASTVSAWNWEEGVGRWDQYATMPGCMNANYISTLTLRDGNASRTIRVAEAGW